MKVWKRSRVVGALVCLFALVSGVITIILSMSRLGACIKSLFTKDSGMQEAHMCLSKSPAVSVEELGCISIRFSDIKKNGFDIITLDVGQESNEKLCFEFITSILDLISRDALVPGSGVDASGEERLPSRERKNFKILNFEIRYNISGNSRLLGAEDMKGCMDPSSAASRRLLGLDEDFPDDQDVETEEANRVLNILRERWPGDLDGAECKVSGEKLLLRDYVGSVLTRYLVECKIEEQKRMMRDTDFFMRIGVDGTVGGKPVAFVILSNGECMSPGGYMSIVREILFFMRHGSIISDLNGTGEGFYDTDELWFLLQKCRSSFNRNLSCKFGKLSECEAKDSVVARSDDEYIADKVVEGLLGLTKDFQNGMIRQIKDQDVPIFKYYQGFLSGLVGEKACYRILETKRTIRVKDYVAALLLKGYKSKIYRLASKLEKKTVHRMEITTKSIQARHYLWFLARVIHEIRFEGSNKYHEKLTDGLRRLRENLVLCIELIIHDGKMDHLDPPTKAILRLLGISEEAGIDAEDTNPECSRVFRDMVAYKPKSNSVSAATCILNGIEVPIGEYVMDVLLRYFKECRERDETQEYVDSRVFRSMSEAFSVRYSDGRHVGIEYFRIVRSMLRKVFCCELESLLRQSMAADSSESNVLKYYLDCKTRDVDSFFSRAFLVTVNNLHADEKRIPAHAIVMIERILGKDISFMQDLYPKDSDKRLFNSILSKFPRKYREIKCHFEGRRFSLVSLVAKATVVYLRASSIENGELILQLERNLVSEAAFYEER
uniref:Uncharacterized protein n=1 Tax=Encephalitozoon cuniculi TaxID=6035 RepID=M1K301_ENCCN|nr:hypothetical protein ECU04_0410 [Encephalitozoon cuniculi]